MLVHTVSVTAMCVFFFQIPELKHKDEQDLITLKHSFIKDLLFSLYVSLSVDILDFLTSCLSFASLCADYGEGEPSKRKRCLVMPWMIWWFIAVLFKI